MPNTGSLRITPNATELDTASVRKAEREAKAERKAATANLKLAKAEAKTIKLRTNAETKERELALAQAGLKRSRNPFHFGKVVEVSPSRRARGHLRQLGSSSRSISISPEGSVSEGASAVEAENTA